MTDLTTSQLERIKTSSRASGKPAQNGQLLHAIAEYWNAHIHDLAIAKHPVGSKGFFQDLDEYRFDKLRYLPKVVDFNGYRGKSILEVGCGVGIDLLRFAQGGARVIGVDLAKQSIDLAKKNFELNGAAGEFRLMNGEALEFENNRFDMVYAHGVLQYTSDANKMVKELHRVLKPGGEAIMMVYNRISWLNAMSKVMKVELEHEDAPVLNKYSIAEFKRMLAPFDKVRIVPERFPVASKLQKGWKAALFNGVFVPGFNLLPKFLVRPLGWHIMAFCYK
ncbi:class I SAM-dependent methyltransferase [candidate division KSB1 bacterium]|nr:MAG: class I SAM-dependent methyltransferase [candidate division KSB1 bacterium]MBC6951059.1 class I SAM-dependent methyltransferase [candidate division KSB1 bacterium]MCE7943328.1 class I SAM-dependent methyltransferase [Chlorobi bacterium CHB1]NUM76159.1 class I SAM-dependent methyltransferase [candidate division KSB1 bacterium]